MTSDCDLLGLLLRGLNHVPSSCLAVGSQLPAERLGAMFSLCRQAAWRHRLFREDMWRSCQAAWQGRWLHLAVKLLGGPVRVILTAVASSRDVAASRNFNCCCEQQRLGCVTMFELLLRAAETWLRHDFELLLRAAETYGVMIF